MLSIEIVYQLLTLCSAVIPAPYQVRGKLQRESSYTTPPGFLIKACPILDMGSRMIIFEQSRIKGVR